MIERSQRKIRWVTVLSLKISEGCPEGCGIYPEHPEEFKNTREIMKKYYNWDRIIGNNVGVYEKLFEKYYGG